MRRTTQKRKFTIRLGCLLAGPVLAYLCPTSRADSQLVAEIRTNLSRDPLITVNHLNETLMQQLLDRHEYRAVEEFAVIGTIAVADDPVRIEQLQKHRVRALLAEGKAQEALHAAKALFNVCTMHFVRESLPLLGDSLRAAHPDDRTLVPRFRQQVLANAQEDAAQRKRLADQCGGNSVIEKVEADPAPYANALQQLKLKQDYRSLCSAANLELLSGHVDRAATLLDQAYDASPAADLSTAAEGLARKLKAQDGAIGRANQFVISLRPSE